MLKFSVIVPVYNTEAYLEECIASVLNQPYRDYELILIDDGSTDGSGRVCDQYARTYPDRIRVVHTVNQGPFRSRNHGISLASGDVVLFLDSDDSLRADAMELLSGFIVTHKCDLVLFNAGESVAFPAKTVTLPFCDNAIFEGENKKIIYRKLIESRTLNSVCLKAMTREHIRESERVCHCGKLKHGEDLLLSAHLITTATRIGYLNQGLYHYRIRSGSTTNSFDLNLNDDLKTVHQELDQMIDGWGMPELKALHDARKVSGWMDTLVFLLRNRNSLAQEVFLHQIGSMADDPYFVGAYRNMDSSCLTPYYRWMASSLKKKQYVRLIWAEWVKSRLAALKHRVSKE